MSVADEFDLVTVKSGAKSLRSRACGQTFHPVVGPMIEARGLHVQQQRLVDRAALADDVFVIWDVGLGAGANAIAAIEAFDAAKWTGSVELHSFDHDASAMEFALQHHAELGYLTNYEHQARLLVEEGAACIGGVDWRLHTGDFRELLLRADLPAPHAILYDPYSPTANPEMWTLQHFRALRARLQESVPCLLTNYTRSTAVRVTLLLAGFHVGCGEATGEKDQTTVATNAPELLRAPLDAAWLRRVRSSTASAPLREGTSSGPIAEEDWRELLRHPQFTHCRGGFN
jgi:tRNA U34 5-methylaminomethyl-2-thiouridine-forming methyltransferase MnmC